MESILQGAFGREHLFGEHLTPNQSNHWSDWQIVRLCYFDGNRKYPDIIEIKALAIAIRTIAIAIAIVAKKAIEYCNMQ